MSRKRGANCLGSDQHKAREDHSLDGRERQAARAREGRKLSREAQIVSKGATFFFERGSNYLKRGINYLRRCAICLERERNLSGEVSDQHEEREHNGLYDRKGRKLSRMWAKGAQIVSDVAKGAQFVLNLSRRGAHCLKRGAICLGRGLWMSDQHETREHNGLDGRKRQAARSRDHLSFYKSQFPHKSVNLSSTVTNMKDKLTNLWGS